MKVAGISALAIAALPAASGQARSFELGLTDPVFNSTDSTERGLWLDRAVESGATTVLPAAKWSAVAPDSPAPGFNANDPADPQYDFSRVDGAVRDAVARGLDPMLLVTGAPSFAEGNNRPDDKLSFPPNTYKPKPKELRKFGKAIATRYSGNFDDPGDATGTLPAVKDLQLWAEPNLGTYLTPVYKKNKPVSSLHYRKMLRAFYEGVNAAPGKHRVVTGGTAPYGDPVPGGFRIQPARFWRDVLCLRGNKLKKAKCKKPAKFDVLAHHPINVGKPQRKARNRDDISTPDMGKLKRILKKAERTGRAKGARKHQLWATEIWWESSPPDPDGVKASKHARWLAESFELLYRQGVKRAVWFRIQDAAPNPSFGSTPQTALYLVDGKAKKAQRAYRFPFVARNRGGKKTRLWGIAPSKGKVIIERKKGKRWKKIKTTRANRSRVFEASVRVKRKTKLRARAGGEASLPYRSR